MRHGPLAALLIAAGALAGALRLRSYDLFWHLATGERIVATGAVPRSDPFSFTASGMPWVDHSWLFQVLAWEAWRQADAWGPWLLQVACATGLAVLLLRQLLRWQVPPAAAVVVLLVSLQGMRFRLTFRPELATLLLAAAAAALLCPAPGSRSAWRPLWLVPLTVAWINLHGGALLSPLLVIACLGGALGWRLLRAEGAEPVPWYGLWCAAPLSVAALLVNPYGVDVLKVPFRLSGFLGQPWAANPEWMRPGWTTFPLLYLCVASLLAAGWVRRRSLEPCGFALGMLGAVLALQHVRHVGIFFVLLPFALAPLLARSATWAGVRPPVQFALAAAGLAWIAWAPPWLALSPRDGTLGPGLEPGRYPVAACDFLEREQISGRLFNEVAFGGYLVWRFPDRPVFIDGRNEIYPDLLREIHAGLEDVEAFWAMTRRWELDAALLRYPAGGTMVRYPLAEGGHRQTQRSWSEIYFPDRDWALVYWDDTAMVRVRRQATDPGWLAHHEYRHVNPDDRAFLREELLAGRLQPEPLLEELRRKRGEDPRCRRAAALEEEILRLVTDSARRPQG